MPRIVDDLRLALRTLRRTPWVTGVAVLTLALGIGANTAVFSVVHALLLKPLPYADPHRLVLVWPGQPFNKSLVRRVDEAVPALAAISGISNWTFTLTGDPEPEELVGSIVSPGHFDLLGVQPALGRAFRPEEGEAGRHDVVILAHELWQRRFGGDPHILGRRIPLAGDEADARTVVGVMPQGYRAVAGAKERPQLWAPLVAPESWKVAGDATWYVNWRVARLAPGATLAEAREQLRGEARRLRQEGFNNIDEQSVREADVVPLSRDRAADLAGPLWLLMGCVGLVLLIACANVAHLLLARGEGRERELSIRRALGAGRARLIRQLFTESLILGLAGGALGIAVALAAVRLLAAYAAAEVPRIAEIRVDGAVLLFTVAASLAAALIFGALPALRGARRALASPLRGGSAAALGVPRGRQLPRWLVAAQVALAVVVAVASGLMLRSLHALYSVDPGFDA
ncbi:MAG TPA: ABC transporter permease, partial [Thermoanaerobaculia bacterium]|nr:ABC transporter permease [Thermoanaerobaculia bacterium]